MRTYELTLVFSPDLTTDAQKKLIAKIKKLVEDNKGKVEKADDWGKKEFAYPIAKKTFGYYHCLSLAFPEEQLSLLEKKIKLEEGVLRYLLVKSEGPAYAKASAGKEGKNGTKIAK